jgi:hypothetical protein
MHNQRPSFNTPACIANEKKAALGYVFPEHELAGLELEAKKLPFDWVCHLCLPA